MLRREIKYMKVAVIENKLKDYIIHELNQHQGMELAGFLEWESWRSIRR